MSKIGIEDERVTCLKCAVFMKRWEMDNTISYRCPDCDSWILIEDDNK